MANLTPQQLAALQAALASGENGYQDPSGTYYGLMNAAGVGSEGHGDPGLFGNGMYNGGNYTPGGQYNIYDGQGQDTGRTGQYAQDWSAEMLALKYAAILASAGAAGSALAGAGGAAGGAGGAAAGGIETMAPLTSGLSPISAAGLAPYEMGAAGLGGAGALGSGGVETMGSMTSGMSPLTVGGTEMMAPLTSGLSPLTVASSGLTVPSWLGGAASLVGGLLGSQPQTKTTTSQSQIDPRMASVLFGDGAFIPQVQQQLQRSTSPQAQANWDAIGAKGMGMLSQPVAGNGFSRLTGR